MKQRPWAALLALAAAAAACRTGPPPAIPREMAQCVPPGAVVLAGARLEALRASPLYPRLPASAVAFLQPFRDASDLLLVFNGADLLLIARGHFREAAPGATLAGGNLMLSGSAALVQAALAQRRSGAPGSKDLLAQAEAGAAGHEIWAATRGGVNLPLTGDASNLNRLLWLAQFATVGLRAEPPMQLDFAAQCATPGAANHLEETLRAFLSLAAAGVARQKELAAILKAADVRRDGERVQAALRVPADAMPEILELFGR